jgi:hypothetical protein
LFWIWKGMLGVTSGVRLANNNAKETEK